MVYRKHAYRGSWRPLGKNCFYSTSTLGSPPQFIWTQSAGSESDEVERRLPYSLLCFLPVYPGDTAGLPRGLRSFYLSFHVSFLPPNMTCLMSETEKLGVHVLHSLPILDFLRVATPIPTHTPTHAFSASPAGNHRRKPAALYLLWIPG